MFGPVILGNGGGGTSMFRGLLNAHPEMEIAFEYRGPTGTPEKELSNYIEAAEKSGLLWGNKMPIEQYHTRKWTDGHIMEIIEHFKVIWYFRRFSKYFKVKEKEKWKETFVFHWSRAQGLYWKMREKHPDRVICVSFEDVLLRPEAELMRVCAFLEVKYDPIMLTGTTETGYTKYNQVGFNLNKI